MEAEQKRISPMEKRIINLIVEIENLINSNNENYIKQEIKQENYQETTIRGNDLSITKIQDKDEIEYLILDKRYYMTLITIDGKNPINSKLEMTISDYHQIIEIKEVKESSTIREYINGLKEYISPNKEEEEKQVRSI